MSKMTRNMCDGEILLTVGMSFSSNACKCSTLVLTPANLLGALGERTAVHISRDPRHPQTCAAMIARKNFNVGSPYHMDESHYCILSLPSSGFTEKMLPCTQ